jgi:hypothetical protein
VADLIHRAAHDDGRATKRQQATRTCRCVNGSLNRVSVIGLPVAQRAKRRILDVMNGNHILQRTIVLMRHAQERVQNAAPCVGILANRW